MTLESGEQKSEVYTVAPGNSTLRNHFIKCDAVSDVPAVIR